MDVSILSIAFTQLLALALPALLLAWGTDRLCRSPLLGGLLAGLLLSASVAGQGAPGVYDPIFIGGDEAQQRLTETADERAAMRDDLAATGVTGVAVAEFDAATESMLQPIRDQIDARRRVHAAAHAMLTLTLVAGWLVLAGAAVPVHRVLRQMRDAMPLAIGALVGVAMVAAVGATLLGRMAAGEQAQPWFAGLLIVCLVGAVPISRPLGEALDRNGDPTDADDPLGLVQAVLIVLTLIALIALALTRPIEATTTPAMNLGDGLASLALLALALAAVNPLLRRRRSPIGLALTAATLATLGYVVAGLPMLVVALAVGLALAPGPGPVKASARLSADPRNSRLGACRAVTPVAAAALAMHTSFDGWSWGLWLVVLIAAGDGKAISVWVLGKLFGGRTWTATLPLAGAAAVGGLAPVAVGYVLLTAGIIDHPLFAALVIATVTMELLLRPLVRIVAEDPAPLGPVD